MRRVGIIVVIVLSILMLITASGLFSSSGVFAATADNLYKTEELATADLKSSVGYLTDWSTAVLTARYVIEKKNEQASLDSLINKYSGISASVAFIDLDTGVTVYSGTQEAFTAASTTKVITAVCFLNMVEQGKASLGASVYGCNAQSLIKRMINQSDNTAWHELKSWMGYDYVEAYAHQIGLASFNVRKNTITAVDDALLLQKLYQGQLLNESDTSLLLSFMQNTNNEKLIPAAVPDGADVYHKYGNLNCNLHDTAIIEYNGKVFVLVVFTNGYGQVPLIHQVTATVLSISR